MDCGVSVFSLEESVEVLQLVPGSHKIGAIITMDDLRASSPGDKSSESSKKCWSSEV